MSAGEGGWAAFNQRQLVATIGRLRAALGGEVAEAPAEEQPEAWQGRPPALIALAQLFGLSAFERELLALCAGVELDGGLATLLARAQGDQRATAPSFSLALAILPGAHWSALAPSGPLRRWRLIRVGSGPTLTQSPLRIEERVLHYLVDVQQLDERLGPLLRVMPMRGPLLPSHRALAERGAAHWADGARPIPVLQLCGAERDDLRAVAAALSAAAGLRLWGLRAEELPAAPAELETLARLWEREAALGGLALLVELGAGENSARAARLLAAQLGGPLILAGVEPLRELDREAALLELPRPTAAEQTLAWGEALGGGAQGLDGAIEQLAGQFSLSASAIRSAGRAALWAVEQDRSQVLGEALWAAARAEARPQLAQLTERVETGAAWNDLVLPEHQRSLLRSVVAQVRRRATVIEGWGMGQGGTRGLGVTALFAGASGTGKTLAAEVLANELRLDLYRIDLSQVVSKYIGETEKNLRQIFDAAERGGALLLFDEADALFGKRTEVKDSHDRYANIEVSYLLQRMEQYRGLAVLTTNMKSALDQAFLRRIRFVIQFPFPDAAHRAAIWERIYPPGVPTEGLEIARLAALSVAGGNIRNIALGAAFLAADGGEPVRMGHMLAAARAEYAKLERPLPEAEVADWGVTGGGV